MDIDGAEKKIRQAEFFLGMLIEYSSRPQRYDGDADHLEFLFSACLSAARSVFFILSKTGKARFKDAEGRWRRRLEDDTERAKFNRSMRLRDNDVHVGDTGAEPLQKYVEERLGNLSAYHQPLARYNPALYGGEAPIMEEENPDGAKVRGAVLHGATGLYIEQGGQHIEATTVCREFIDQLRSLLDAVKASEGLETQEMSNYVNGNLPPARLTTRDIALNIAQSLLKAVPWIGEALSQFIFGPLVELRMKRAERTLAELGEAIRDSGGRARVDTEEFANLLEKVLPQIGRSIREERRVMLRNLLINAAHIEPRSSRWDEADLAAELIEQIDAPGLAVIAALSKCKSRGNFISSQPTPRIFDGGTEFAKPTEVFHVVDFEWPIVEEWVRRLYEKRLIGYGSSDARGGFANLQLTDLGQLVVAWSRQLTGEASG